MERGELLVSLAIVYLAAAIAGFAATRLRLPLVVGYLVGGLLIGPHVLGFVGRADVVGMFADIGVTFLVFSIGTQVSLKELRAVRSVAIFGGAVQMAATMAVGFDVARLLGWNAYHALFIAALIAVSSTAVVLKTLVDLGELDTVHGRVALGILLVQDLAVVGLLALLVSLPNLAWSVIKAAAVVALALLVTRRVIPAVLARVALTNSREVFVIALVALAIASSIGAASLGLALSLGAFIMGLAISESEFRYQTLAAIVPLRDVFAALFFVSVGMLIDPSFVLSHPGILAAVVGVITVGKFAITWIVTRLHGYGGRTSFIAAISLIQIGEFSIVMARVGLRQGLIGQDIYSTTLSAALFTILITPFAIKYSGRLYSLLASIPLLHPLLAQPREAGRAGGYSMNGHVVICGYGRIGRTVGEALQSFDKPFVVADYDLGTVLSLRREGIQAIYGDAANPEVLEAMEPETASLAVVALADAISIRTTTRLLRASSPGLRILVRAIPGLDFDELFSEGASEVFQVEFEAGLEIMRHTLLHSGIPADSTQSYVQSIRDERYRPMEDAM
ncbi:MAG: cation:proton antiporter [Armatimonadota bacterium]